MDFEKNNPRERRFKAETNLDAFKQFQSEIQKIRKISGEDFSESREKQTSKEPIGNEKKEQIEI